MIAKGPNILNLNAYTQGEEQQGQYTEEVPSDRPIVDSKAIQDQFDNFVKQLHKYAQVLSNVAKNIDQASQDQFITDFYPEFILQSVYQDDQQKKIIGNSDPELAKVLNNLQRTNKVLKEQMKGWVFEFAKKTKLSQVLLDQNQILRKAILSKNKQIVKLIQNIGKTQNEQIEQLKQNLQELNEQNGVLLDHLTKIKQDLKDKKQDQKRIIEAVQNSKKTLLDAEKKCKQTQDKEQHYSKMVALLQDSIEQMQKRKRKLQKEKARLQNFKKQYSKDKSNLQNQVNLCQNDKRQIQNSLKAKFDSHQIQKNALIQKIQQQTQKVQKQKDQTRFYQGQISKNQRRILQFNAVNKDLKQKTIQNQQIFKRLKTQFQQIFQIETKNASDIDILTFDIEQLKQQIEKNDQIEKRLIQSHKKLVKQVDEKNKNYLIELQGKQAKINRDMAMKILQQKSELSIKEKQIQKWQSKIFEKKQQITDLKSQIKQIKNNQVKISELRQKLRQQQKRS